MERYRSGHNGADSKSVCRKRHVGSNPTRSAIAVRLSNQADFFGSCESAEHSLDVIPKPESMASAEDSFDL